MNKQKITIVVLSVLLIINLGVSAWLFNRVNLGTKSNIWSPSSSGESAKLVENFPSMSVYKNATLLKSACVDDKSMLFTASWQTTGDVNDVMSWYETNLSAEGWKIDVPRGSSAEIQYAEYVRGNVNSWLGRLQIGARKENDHVIIEASYPAPDSEMEDEEESE